MRSVISVGSDFKVFHGVHNDILMAMQKREKTKTFEYRATRLKILYT